MMKSNSLQNLQRSNSLQHLQRSLQEKRKPSDISDINPKKRRLDTRSKKTANPWKEALWFHLFSPPSCTEMVTENRYKPISCDEPDSDSLVHIH